MLCDYMPGLRNALLTIFVGVLGALPIQADTLVNPYSAVVARNAFGLKDPPPPKIETLPPPAAPLPKVVLTGIVTSLMGREPRVLLEVTEQEPGKAANVKKPIMRQGEKDGTIEILTIDIANNQVTIRNGGVQTNVTFEVAKASSTPAPGLPGLPGLAPPPQAPNPVHSANVGSPTIISPGGANAAGRSGTGVSVFGGMNNPVTPTGGAPVNYASVAANPYTPANQGYAAVATTPGVSTYGSGSSIPSRDLRVDPAAPPTAQQVYQNMIRQKQAADQAGVLMPPLPPSPHLQGAGGSPPAFPPIPNRPR
jgi:hypothetical protein